MRPSAVRCHACHHAEHKQVWPSQERSGKRGHSCASYQNFLRASSKKLKTKLPASSKGMLHVEILSSNTSVDCLQRTKHFFAVSLFGLISSSDTAVPWLVQFNFQYVYRLLMFVCSNSLPLPFTFGAGSRRRVRAG